jgi:aminoglycoside N3'-acetyltransferase
VQRLKAVYKGLRLLKRRAEIKRSEPCITRDRIVSDLHQLGTRKGDTILVHSSLKSLGFVEDGPRGLIDALIEAVSPDGTVIIPTYQMIKGSMLETCLDRNYIFDPRTAGTFLGFVPSAFLKYPGVKRSIHPTHSVSAIGKNAEYITEAHHHASSTFGKDSPWDRFVKLDGLVLGLGVTMAPVGLYHFIEDMIPDEFPVPARSSTAYNLKCRDWDGNIIEVPVNPHEPDVAQGRIDRQEYISDYFRDEFMRVGLMKMGRVGEGNAWFIPAKAFYNHLVELMREGITIYSTPEEFKKRPIPKTEWSGRHF